METKEDVKTGKIGGSSAFSDRTQRIYPFQGVLDLYDSDGDKSSLGFMELLGMQDFGSSVFDVIQVPSTLQPAAAANNQGFRNSEESPEVLTNRPATPNSSSISSASSEALNDEPVKATADKEEIEQHNTKKGFRLKAKKRHERRQREPRLAFVTKSDVDHLEDGYRWRKYGQKAVKNSHFPRSYYRCTAASCNVKKRIERSLGDPSLVVTTYEGQHTHPSPLMPHPSFAGAASDSGFSAAAAAFAIPMHMGLSLHQQNRQQPPPPPPFGHGVSPLGFGYSETSIATSQGERRFRNILGSASKDNGLLQDIFPSSPMIKEE